MRYMLLIYKDEAKTPPMESPEMAPVFAAYGEVMREMREEGVFLDGRPLYTTPAATSVRMRDGRMRLTDGPFAETKEQLAGYFMVEARDREQAVALAARIPGAASGHIEVREVMPFP